MIHDIGPSVFSNAFSTEPPAPDAPVFAFRDGAFLARFDGGLMTLPSASEFWRGDANRGHRPIRLFAIDEQEFYLAFPDEESASEPAVGGFEWTAASAFRSAEPFHLRLATSTALHLSRWYGTNRFCGRCGRAMDFDVRERALFCPACGNRVYPRINPAVIVAVRDGDRLLMTRYAGPRGRRHRALVAGFCEIGETAEQTVAREVHEEVGIRVKDIRYYKSQPWGFAGDLLLGFVCDLDGESELHVDGCELASAQWVARDEIYEEDDWTSLTREMIIAFKNGLL